MVVGAMSRGILIYGAANLTFIILGAALLLRKR
jgi:hypothetical protein